MEILHSLGLIHTHMRPDRNKHIGNNDDNISPEDVIISIDALIAIHTILTLTACQLCTTEKITTKQQDQPSQQGNLTNVT